MLAVRRYLGGDGVPNQPQPNFIFLLRCLIHRLAGATVIGLRPARPRRRNQHFRDPSADGRLVGVDKSNNTGTIGKKTRSQVFGIRFCGTEGPSTSVLPLGLSLS